jgi:hypothetical protein
VVYVVTGKHRFYLECKRSILSLRAQGYEGPILVLAERPTWLGGNLGGSHVRLLVLEGACGYRLARAAKTRLGLLSPFVETLSLDTDTTILKPVDGIWKFLETAPVAFARDVDPTLSDVLRTNVLNGGYSLQEAEYTRRLCPATTWQPNSGVMLFRRCPQVRTLFEAWTAEWDRFQCRDQLALMRALVRTDIPVAVLPPQYNAHRAGAHGANGAVIHHYWPADPAQAARRRAAFAQKLLRTPMRWPAFLRLARILIPRAGRERIKRVLDPLERGRVYRQVLRSRLRHEILGEPPPEAP